MAVLTQGRRTQSKPPTLAQKTKALTDFWAFLDVINFQGGSHRFAKCHKDLWEWYSTSRTNPLTGNRHLTLMPRGHLKSTIMSVGRVLWRIYQNPNVRIFVGTSKNELSSAFIREAKAYLENDWLQEHVWNVRPHIKGNLIPTMDRLGRSRRKALEEDGEYTEALDKKIIWRSNALQVNREFILKEPTLMVGSVGSQATGMHFDEAQFDDIITFDNISSPDKRDKMMSWIYDIESIIDPEYHDDWIAAQLKTVKLPADDIAQISRTGGVFNIVGTRYDLEDYYGYIIEHQKDLGFNVYERNIYVNGIDSGDGYLWAEKWNEQLEQSTRRSMTASRFASQYLNKVIATGDIHLAWDKIRPLQPDYWQLSDSGQSIFLLKKGETQKQIINLVMTVDTASSVSDTADYTCLCVGGKDKEGNYYLLAAALGRWRSTEILDQIYKMANFWNMRTIHVEAVGGFKHFTQFIRDSFDKYRPLGVIEYRPKGEKTMRILNTLEPLINNGMMWMEPRLFGNKLAADQMMFFPRKTMHDDFPDCLAMNVELAKKPVKHQQVKRYASNQRWGGIR